MPNKNKICIRLDDDNKEAMSILVEKCASNQGLNEEDIWEKEQLCVTRDDVGDAIIECNRRRDNWHLKFYQELLKQFGQDNLGNIPTTIEKGDKTYLPVSAFSKDGQNFMKIRILDPSSKLWHPFKKIIVGNKEIESISRTVYMYDPSSEQRFITLDIGDLEEPGIQGIAFIRGVPSSVPIPKDNFFNWSNFMSQAIRIEYAVLGLSEDSPAKEKIDHAIKHYSKDIIHFLKREYPSLEEIAILPKGNDFELVIDAVESKNDIILSQQCECKQPEPIPFGSLSHTFVCANCGKNLSQAVEKALGKAKKDLLGVSTDALASEKIRVFEETKEKLDGIKLRLEKKTGGNVSYAQVIKRLVEHYEKSRLLKKGMEEALAYSQKMLELALKNRPEIIVAGGGVGGMPASAVPISTGRTTPGVPPPPLPPRTPPKETGNLRQDFKNEISAVLSGTPLTPQQVLALAKPKHSEKAGPPVEETISQKAAKKAEEKMGKVVEPPSPVESQVPVIPPSSGVTASESPTPVTAPSDAGEEQLSPEINEQILGKTILLLDTMIGRMESIDINNPPELTGESPIEENLDATKTAKNTFQNENYFIAIELDNDLIGIDLFDVKTGETSSKTFSDSLSAQAYLIKLGFKQEILTKIKAKKGDSDISFTAQQKRIIEKWILFKIIDLQGIINEKELIDYKIPAKYRSYAPKALEILAGKHLILPSISHKGWEANMKLITKSAKDFPEYFITVKN